MPRIPIATAAIVIGMCVFWGVLGSRILPSAQKHDFLNLYTGGRLALDGRFSELHDIDVQLAEERKAVPDLPQLVPFVRPIFYALVLAPLATLPYLTAFGVWIGLQTALLFACWIWAWRRFGADALVYCCMFLPAPLGIASGQDCVVMLALLIAASEMNRRGKPVASGAILALMLFKFHLVLLWPVALLLQKRWRMLAGYCAGAAVEIVISLALGGLADARLYVSLLRNKSLDHLSPSPQLMVRFEGFLANLGIGATWASALLIGAIVIVFLVAIRSAPLFVLAPLASLLVVPHVYGYDAAVLLGPILWVIFEWKDKAARIMAALLSTPICFGFALADKPWAIISSASLMVFFGLLVRSKEVKPAPLP
jgi:hypothetical protein